MEIKDRSKDVIVFVKISTIRIMPHVKRLQDEVVNILLDS